MPSPRGTITGLTMLYAPIRTSLTFRRPQQVKLQISKPGTRPGPGTVVVVVVVAVRGPGPLCKQRLTSCPMRTRLRASNPFYSVAHQRHPRPHHKGNHTVFVVTVEAYSAKSNHPPMPISIQGNLSHILLSLGPAFHMNQECPDVCCTVDMFTRLCTGSYKYLMALAR